jgi:F0F1-type ATP synthase assembly protein I
VKFTPSKPMKNDDTVGRGMEFALMTLLFLGLGYALDRWLGTEPLFMIALVLLALIGQFVRMWYDYDARMRVHEQQRAGAAHPNRERVL